MALSTAYADFIPQYNYLIADITHDYWYDNAYITYEWNGPVHPYFYRPISDILYEHAQPLNYQ